MMKKILHSLIEHYVDNLMLFNCFEVLVKLMVKMCWLFLLKLNSGDVLVEFGAVLFQTKQPKSKMLLYHEFCLVEK